MHKFILTTLSVALLTSFFTLPAQAGGENELIGLGLGGALGGLFGNQFGHGDGRVAMTTAGVIVGGLIGDSVGRSVDRENSYYPSASSGTPYTPIQLFDSPSPYSTPNYVAPPAPDPSEIYMDSSYGAYCREFSQQVRIGNQVRESYGTACLQPDGSWRVTP